MQNEDLCLTNPQQDQPAPFRSHIPADWSARIQLEVSLQDLDPDAIALARERYKAAH